MSTHREPEGEVIGQREPSTVLFFDSVALGDSLPSRSPRARARAGVGRAGLARG